MTKIFAVYDWDQGPFIISAHDSAEQAIKGLSDHGFGKIMEWSLYDTFHEAVDRWEGRRDEDRRTDEMIIHSINYRDDEVACGHIAYNDPVLISSDDAKVSCAKCREVIGQPLQVMKTRTPTVDEQIASPIQRDAIHILKQSPFTVRPTVTACDLDTRLIDGLRLAESAAGVTCTHCKKELA